MRGIAQPDGVRLGERVVERDDGPGMVQQTVAGDAQPRLPPPGEERGIGGDALAQPACHARRHRKKGACPARTLRRDEAGCMRQAWGAPLSPDAPR